MFLYVEDNDARYRAVVRYLAAHDIASNVERAHTLDEATAIIRTWHEDISFVLTDWSFPSREREGFALAYAGAEVVDLCAEYGLPHAVISGSERSGEYHGLWITGLSEELQPLLDLIRAPRPWGRLDLEALIASTPWKSYATSPAPPSAQRLVGEGKAYLHVMHNERLLIRVLVHGMKQLQYDGPPRVPELEACQRLFGSKGNLEARAALQEVIDHIR